MCGECQHAHTSACAPTCACTSLFLLSAPMDRFCCAARGLSALRDDVVPINQDYPGLVKVFNQPPVFLVPSFFTAAECDALVCASFGRLQPAHVIGRGDSTNR